MVSPVHSSSYFSPQEESHLATLDCSPLANIITQFGYLRDGLQAMGGLRGTCRALKAKIESNECALPFLRYLGADVDAERWNNAYNVTKSWFPLFMQWFRTPLTVVAVDYSESMDESYEEGLPTHLRVAWSMLIETYETHQLALRPLVVYLFAEHCVGVELNNQDDVRILFDIMAQNPGRLTRQDSALYSVFNELSLEEYSPIQKTPFFTNILIKVISDQGFSLPIIQTTLSSLSALAQREVNRTRNFTIELVPTSIGSQANQTYRMAQEELSFYNLRNIFLDVDVAPAARRMRFDPSFPESINLLDDPMDLS